LSQAQAEQVVHDDFERLAAAAHFLFEEHGDVVVDGKSGAHIMMLMAEAS
jgi:hypothetical protein